MMSMKAETEEKLTKPMAADTAADKKDVKWTPAQLEAITLKGTDILVGAAAGSGKTASLTERIVSSIVSGGADVSRILAVTFTKAAAAELKSRISNALRRAAAGNPGNRRIARQLSLLPGASIGTIHSFCLTLLRSHYAELGIPPDIRVADEAEASLLRRECMEETIDAFYNGDLTIKSTNLDFATAADNISDPKGDGKLASTLLSLYEKLSGHPEKQKFLYTSADKLEAGANAGAGFFATAYGEPIKRYLDGIFEHYEAVLAATCDEFAQDVDYAKKYLPTFEYSLNFVRRARSFIKEDNYAGLREHLAKYEAPKLGGIRGREHTPRVEYFREARTKLKKIIDEVYASYLSADKEAVAESMRRTANVLRAIADVLTEFEANYSKAKLSRSLCDFSDLEHMAIRLLYDENGERSPAARAIASRYDAIYIDEYQDVNLVQEKIFSAIGNGKNMFMVGDVKQSIYGFRGAEPGVFDERRRRYLKSGGGKYIFMSENFRSEAPIIDFVNAVCAPLFKTSRLYYDKSDDLVAARKTDAGFTPPSPRVVIIEKPHGYKDENCDSDGENQSEIENTITGDDFDREAEWVAAEIARIIKTESKSDGSPYSPGDFAILLRSAKEVAPAFEDALRRHGVMSINDTAANFFECPEVLLVLCFLNVIDNPLRDIYTSGALRSPVFGFTLDDLVRLKLAYGTPVYTALRRAAADAAAIMSGNGDVEAKLPPELYSKCSHATETILRWRDVARSAPADELIKRIYADTGIRALVYADANATGTSKEYRDANLTALYERARAYEASRFRGLHRFIDFINGMIEAEANNPAPRPTGGDENAVHIMTIHQSKGLEFPVVFVSRCGRERSREDEKKPILIDSKIGAAMKLRADDSGKSPVIIDTLPRKSLAAAAAMASAEEEMRVLYVALTRAKERLYVTSCVPDPEKLVRYHVSGAEFFSRHTVMSERTYIGWILASLGSSGVDIKSKAEIIRVGDELPSAQASEPFAKVKEDVEGVTSAEIRLAERENAKDAADTGENADEESSTQIKVSEYEKLFRERFCYQYPYARIGAIPAKITVSHLYPDSLDEDMEPKADIDIDTDVGKSTFSDTTSIRLPPYASLLHKNRDEAALRGTATHLFLQFCDFAAAEKYGVEAEADRLTTAGFITKEDREIINIHEVENFLRSDIYRRMKAARRVWREQRFRLRLPAAFFSRREDKESIFGDEKILVQGVIDSFFVEDDGGVIIIDYKTDRLSRAELNNPALAAAKLIPRHSRQLAYYRAAVSLLLDVPQKSITPLIYSLPLGAPVYPTEEDLIAAVGVLDL